MRRSRTFAATVVVATMVGLATMFAAPANAVSSSVTYTRIGDYRENTFAHATNINNLVTMRPPSFTSHQLWDYTRFSSGYYRFMSHHTGGCLAVAQNSTAYNPPVVQRPCQGNYYERWQLVQTGTNRFVFRSVGMQGRCIGVNRSYDVDRLFAVHCDYGALNQQFTVRL